MAGHREAISTLLSERWTEIIAGPSPARARPEFVERESRLLASSTILLLGIRTTEELSAQLSSRCESEDPTIVSVECVACICTGILYSTNFASLPACYIPPALGPAQKPLFQTRALQYVFVFTPRCSG